MKPYYIIETKLMEAIMKRVLIAIICFAALSFNAFSQSERWNVFAFEGENYHVSVKDDSEVIHSFGFNYSTYRFESHRLIGLYTGSSFYFPQKIILEDAVGNEIKLDHSDFDFIMGYRGIFGPAFRFPILPMLTLKVATGFSFGTMVNTYDNHYGIDINLGIGGDLGVKLDMSKKWSMVAGTKVGYDFFNYCFTKNGGHKDSGRTRDYSLLRVDPYIGFAYTYLR